MTQSILKLQSEWRKDLVLIYICLDGLSFILENSPSILSYGGQGYNFPILRDQSLDFIFGSLHPHFLVLPLL